MAERRSLLPPGGQAFLGSAVFASAVTTAIFLTAFSTQLLRSLLGWPGLLSIIAGLIIAALASLWYRRTHLEWHGTLPISVVVFVGWAVLSVFWSDTTISTGMRLVYLLRSVSWASTSPCCATPSRSCGPSVTPCASCWWSLS